MKRPGDELDEEHTVPQEKRKCTESQTKLCTPYCPETDCTFRGKHDPLILSLVNLQESQTTSLEEWKAYVHGVKETYNFNQPINDPDPNLSYPLLHWAAMLGKVKAVKWLLQQEFVNLNLKKTHEDRVGIFTNVSNETVLFSTARWLHEGVSYKDTQPISNAFAKVLDPFLKHDSAVLLVQESPNDGTVLHLCARGEDDSSAPFFVYLKRILGKLQEYDSKTNDKLPLKDMLEAKNRDGDTFLHLLAKSNRRKEVEELIQKFPTLPLKKMINTDGKTADDILKELEPDPEDFQTSSQDIEASDEEEGKPLRDHVDTEEKVKGCDAVLINGADTEVNCSAISSKSYGLTSQFNARVYPEAQSSSDWVVKEEGKQVSEISEDPEILPVATRDVPSLIENQGRSFKTLEKTPPEIGYHSTSLQSLCNTVVLKEESHKGSTNHISGAEVGTRVQSVNPQPVDDTDAQRRAQDAVKALITEKKTQLNKVKIELEKAMGALNDCEEKEKQLLKEKEAIKDAVEKLEEDVKTKENELERSEESLLKLEF